MKYVKVDDLQAYCDNQIDHSITPNDFQRMNHLEIIRCRECKHYDIDFCKLRRHESSPDFSCFAGEVSK